MNSLHQVIDAISEGYLGETSGVPRGDSDRFATAFSKFATAATCFHMGNLEDLETLQVIPELVQLPYDTCWFEVALDAEDAKFGRSSKAGALVWKCGTTDSSFGIFGSDPMMWQAVFFIRDRDGWKYLGNAECPIGRMPAFVSYNDPLRLATMNLWKIIQGFLSALNCVNVQRVETLPDAKLQAARKKRGKQPLFSTWTLDIFLPRTIASRTSLGGTHASPRAHLRRKFYRQFAPGKYTWVRACRVGHGPGIVHKDYAAKYKPDTPPARTP